MPLFSVNDAAAVAAAVADFGCQHVHEHVRRRFDTLLHRLRFHIQKRISFLGGESGSAQHLRDSVPIDELRLDMSRLAFLATGDVFLIPVKLHDTFRILRGIAAVAAVKHHIHVRRKIESLYEYSSRAGNIVIAAAVGNEIRQLRELHQREYLFHNVGCLLPPLGHGVQGENIIATVRGDHVAADQNAALIIHIHCRDPYAGNIVAQDAYSQRRQHGRGQNFLIPQG